MGDLKVRAKISFVVSLILGFGIVVASIYGYLLLRQRPGIPASIPEKDLVRIGEVDILTVQDKYAALAGKEIGDPVDFYMRDAGRPHPENHCPRRPLLRENLVSFDLFSDRRFLFCDRRWRPLS